MEDAFVLKYHEWFRNYEKSVKEIKEQLKQENVGMLVTNDKMWSRSEFRLS